jgi:hypothetical protein
VAPVLLLKLGEFIEAHKALPESNLDSQEATLRHINFCALLRGQLGTSILRDPRTSSFSTFKRVFDRVWNEGPLHKLRTLGTPLALYHNLRCFYEDADCTAALLLTAGIRLGSLLSPLLFELFMRNTPLPANPALHSMLMTQQLARP